MIKTNIVNLLLTRAGNKRTHLKICIYLLKKAEATQFNKDSITEVMK